MVNNTTSTMTDNKPYMTDAVSKLLCTIEDARASGTAVDPANVKTLLTLSEGLATNGRFDLIGSLLAAGAITAAESGNLKPFFTAQTQGATTSLTQTMRKLWYGSEKHRHQEKWTRTLAEIREYMLTDAEDHPERLLCYWSSPREVDRYLSDMKNEAGGFLRTHPISREGRDLLCHHIAHDARRLGLLETQAATGCEGVTVADMESDEGWCSVALPLR
ncbi:uncharacterized protein MKK02DRAFT_41725 [Dioszegia hungarica]|uniref:Uncharacterized protein n=1 Tax=Dioszegia hungarica TaxID=4972 RepID=A0AA38LQK9_9TREE|nr:uncharacterized protein MKK02DRAFT_41716 [Dioszegia hungarica]XP_052941856.1 uncharacterized protein MKK02DRAFT_41725 [Dioszegia hungarica]KAI9632070.1 hypothetical protein MKK02DRAFT_41716 [Dioszegia hungarica]KAI9632079.1 hypothetical protein MKK02DRAFT_41725 [Dioszegia hungarica]